jgi:8-oxo-dGTP diphosphatase
MRKGVDYTGVCVVFHCHDGQGNFLMQKRGANCRDEQGCWDVGAGGIETHVTVEDTLRSEIMQEYCTDVLSYSFLGYREAHRESNAERTHWIGLDFKVLVDREKVRNGEPHKFDEIGWFAIDNLPSPRHSQLSKAFDMYMDKLQDDAL